MKQEDAPFDHHSPEFAADPWAALASMRDECPVRRTEAHGGYWVLTSYAGVSEASHCPAVFSSAHDRPYDTATRGGVVIPQAGIAASFIEMDPPASTEYRKLLARWFAPEHVRTLEPAARQLAVECIDRIAAAGGGDLVADVALPVPGALTMDVVGLARDDWSIYATAIHEFAHTVPGPEMDRIVLIQHEMLKAIEAAVMQRRTQPRDDFLTWLTQAEITPGRHLSDEEIVEACHLIIGGGVDTTTSLTSSALAYLGTHPEQREILRRDPGKIRIACEEFLRVFPPVMAMARTVVEDVAIGGEQLRSGDRVLLHFGGANRDEQAFDRAGEIALDRFPNKHTSFGLGPHRCLGSNLARMEFRIILEEVLRRIPDYEIDYDAAQLYPSLGLNYGYISLPTRIPTPKGGS